MKITIAGGTGFIGSELVSHFENKNYQVVVLGRTQVNKSNYFQWDGKSVGEWKNQLKGTDVLINLAGKSVDCRYTEENKKEIFDSRTNSIEVLEKAFKQIGETPKTWIQASTATIYRDEYESPNDEENGKIGGGFSVEVAKKWEASFDKVELITKKVTLRMAIVLGDSGGAFPVLKRMTRFGLGGKQGEGNQMISWIHIKDLIQIIDLALYNQWVNGVINCAAPEPVSNKAFMKQLKVSLNQIIAIPTPAWLLKFGAKIIGTETELILKSRWVVSKKLDSFGYKFQFPTIKSALENLK